MKKAGERRLEHSTDQTGILSSKNNEFQVSLGNIVRHKDRVYQTNLVAETSLVVETNLVAESFVYSDTLPEKSIDNLRSIF